MKGTCSLYGKRCCLRGIIFPQRRGYRHIRPSSPHRLLCFLFWRSSQILFISCPQRLFLSFDFFVSSSIFNLHLFNFQFTSILIAFNSNYPSQYNIQPHLSTSLVHERHSLSSCASIFYPTTWSINTVALTLSPSRFLSWLF